MKIWIDKFCKKIVTFIFITIAFILLLSRLFFSVQFSINESHLSFAKLFNFFNIYSIAIISLITLFFIKCKLSISKKYTYILAFLIPVCIGIIFMCFYDYKIFYDSLNCFNIATFLANDGSLATALELENKYLFLFPYQYGFITVLKFFIMLFNNNAIIYYKLIQVVLYGLANVYLLKIVYIFSDNDENNLIYIVFSLLWIIPYSFAPYVYGFSFGLCLSIFSLYNYLLFCKGNDIKRLIIAEILIIIAVFIKMNYAILQIAYVLYFIFFYHNDIKKKILYVLSSFCVLMVALNFNGIYAKLFDQYDLPKGVPMTGFVIMSNPDTSVISDKFAYYTMPGYYSNYNIGVAEYYNYDVEKINIQMSEDLEKIINYTISNPQKALNYYKYKLLATWDTSDFLSRMYMIGEGNYDESSICDQMMEEGILKVGLEQITNVGVIIILLGSILCLIINKPNDEYLLILMWFLGGFVYHLFFETKAIYVYPYITILLPLGVVGYKSGIKYIINKKLTIFHTIVGIVICAVITYLWNVKSYEFKKYESYPDNEQTLRIANKENFLTLEVNLENTNLSAIECKYSGQLNGDKLNIVISAGKKTFKTEISQDELNKSPGWLKIDIGKMSISSPTDVKISFYTDGDENDFSLFFGSSQWANGDLIVNDVQIEDTVIDLKIYELKTSNAFYYQDLRDNYIRELYYHF